MRKTGAKFYRIFQIMIAGITLMTMLASGLVGSYQPVFAAAGLTVEIIAAPNLIVDSNVMSPSTQQPIVATVIGKFCNTTGTDIANVTGYIGDYNAVTPANSTPGTYPPNTPGTITDGVVSTTYVGTYQFTHLGGAADATRYIGTVPANSCKYQYWSFTYPKYAKNAGGTIPSWGTSVKAGDDLWLNFDIWGNYPGQTATYTTHRMTMRNEISAMANKIEPNGNPGGQWFNTDTSTVLPGQKIVTNGILYRLGNVNQGFDNDGNGVPDYNAWLQPFGNPSYDPSCFRLISTTGTVTVSTTSGEVVIPFKDNLYFTDLPQNNTNVVGEVFYEFLALGGACTIPISPYQEAASGSDNEKFNGDYGAGPAPVGTYAPAVTISKTAPGSVKVSTPSVPQIITYTIPFANTSTTSTAGLTLSVGGVDAPLTVEDWVPSSLEYVCGSANVTFADGSNTVTIYYSTDSGLSWSETQPASCLLAIPVNPVSTGPSSLIGLRWKLNNPLPKHNDPGDDGTATFQAKVPEAYITGGGNPFIENCAEAKFGVGSTPFAEDCVTTMVEGTGQIGNRVWVDANANGIQDTTETTQISNIGLSLYWDKNGNGLWDSEDVLVETQNSGSKTDTAPGTDIGANTNYNFTGLPAGKYLVKIDKNDADIDTGATVGYALTGPDTYAVTLAAGGNFNTADFGFGPVLVVDKHISTLDSNAYEGGLVTFHVNMYNKLPGDGTASGFCKYTLYAATQPTVDGTPSTGSGNAAWVPPANGLGSPDGNYARTDMSDNVNTVGYGGYNVQGKGNITSVHLVTHLVVTKQLQASVNEYVTYSLNFAL